MKHIEPQRKAAKSNPLPKAWSRSKILVAALAAIGIIGFGMSTFFGEKSDHIPESIKAQLQENFTHMQPISLPKVSTADTPRILDSMKLDPASKRDLEKTLQNTTQEEPTELALVKLWDFAAEDGDIVEVSTAGYQIQVPLKNTPVEIAIPIDKTHTLALKGIQDGGGGITLALSSDAAGIQLPLLSPGQTITIPTK